jgi:hypothetical protein
MYTITGTNFGKTMKFNCHSLNEAKQLADAMQNDGFIDITITKKK